jgi:hypothetical protein
VSFTPIAAPSLGTPTKTWLITADTMDHQRLVLICDDATYGRYIVDESLSETSQSELETSIQGPIQTLRDGTMAVLVMGDVSNGIMWREQADNFDGCIRSRINVLRPLRHIRR